jgi:hypothetical protein
VINNKAYVGVFKTDTGSLSNQWWEYDPSNDSWTRKADFPGSQGYGAVHFVLGNNAFVGTGDETKNDFWSYDPNSDRWTRKQDAPSSVSSNFTTSFDFPNYEYAATGVGDRHPFWRYDQSADEWSETPQTYFPLYLSNSFYVTFVLYNRYGYVMNTDQSWRLDPANGNWINVAYLADRFEGAGFVINNTGYYVGGKSFYPTYHSVNECWSFSP